MFQSCRDVSLVEQFKVSYGSTKARKTLQQAYCAPQLDGPPHKNAEPFILLNNEDQASLLLYIHCLLYIQFIENLDVNSDHNVEACIGGYQIPYII